MTHARCPGVILLAAGLACGEDPGEPAPEAGALSERLEADLPETLAALGLFPDLTELDHTDPGATGYATAFPLWSNGSVKRRHVVLPRGARVDTSDAAAWQFPAGTTFFKTFSYPDARAAGGERPVETRVLRLRAEGDDYATYVWDESGRSATLADPSRPSRIAVELEGERFEHVVPARLDCRKCHESQPAVVLGFDELGLNHTPAGSTVTELERLLEAGVLDGAPLAPDPIEAPDALSRDVLGYLEGNCTHCHNGGDRASAAFDLRHPVAFEQLIDRETESEALSGLRVAPGEPESSALFLALERSDADNIQPMPPVGVERVDAQAVELFRRWIEGLPGAAPEAGDP